MKNAQKLNLSLADAAQTAGAGQRIGAVAIEGEPLRLLKSAPTTAAEVDQKVEALGILASALLREVEALRRPAPAVAAPGFKLTDEVERFEAALIRAALMRTGGRLRQTARLLGMKVTTLHSKIRRYNIAG